jgi:hypothetical protein
LNSRSLKLCSAIAIATYPLMACTDLVSSEHFDINSTAPGSGMVYSLPKGQFLLTATRSPVDLSALNSALSVAETALAAATKPSAAGGQPPAATEPAVMAAQASVDAATAKLDLLAPMIGGTRVPTMQEVVSLSPLPFVPDPSARYVATFKHGPWRDDNLQLTVVSGLLSNSTLVSQDQIPAIAESIASTIISLAAGIPSPAAVPVTSPVAAASCLYSFSTVFDPLNEDEVEQVNTKLAIERGNDRNLSVQVSVPGAKTLVRPSTNTQPDFASTVTQPRQKSPRTTGLFYRIATPVVVTATYKAAAAAAGTACQLSSIPQVTPVAAIVPDSRTGEEMRVDASAGWLTTTTIGLTFTNGMLTSQSVQRPSELLALVGIPAAIINQFTTILTNFLQLRVNYATADATIATQRANALAAQITQLQTIAQIATAGPTADAKSRLALLQIQQQLQALQQQLAQPSATP